MIFHIVIISCLCSRFHVRNQWFFYSVITFSYTKCFVHSYTVDVVFTLSYRSIWSVQEPEVDTWESGEGMNKWTMMYKRSMQDSKSAKLFEKWGSATETKEALTAYNDEKRVAKHAAWLANSGANSEEKEEITTVSPKSGVFRIVKQMDHTNQNVIDENFVWKAAWLVAHLAS